MSREIIITASAGALAGAAARNIASVLHEAIARRARASICLTGGSTPKPTYELLAGSAGTSVDWSQTDIWFGDERCVPPDHKDSNFCMANAALISRVPVPGERVHRIPGEDGAREAAQSYDSALREHYSGDQTAPTFDILLLGVGPDGHIASLFPGSQSLGETARWVVGTQAPDGMPVQERVSVTIPVFNRARHVMFLVEGAGKRGVLESILVHGTLLPAALVHGLERTTWMMDETAAPPGI